MQHFILCALVDPNTTAVRLFSMDFSKAFESVKHSILTEKLKKWPCLNPRIVNWYIAFLSKRKQRVVYQGVACAWKSINKGTVQGSVSGPHLFNVFMNDLESDNSNDTSLIKFADDSNIAVVVRKNQPYPSELHVEHLKTWSADKKLYEKKKLKSQPEVSGHPQKKALPRFPPLFQCCYNDVDFSFDIFLNLQNNIGQGVWGKRKPLSNVIV